MAITGSGTQGDPYVLYDFSDLELVGTTPYTVDKWFRLNNDIDATPTQAPEYNSGAGWLPRASNITRFSGNFDGNGKSISGLYINRPVTDYIGLFGAVSGTIQNLTLTGVDITGGSWTGAVCGNAESSTTATITNCSVTGTVTGGPANVGGITGYGTKLSLSGCSVNATVSGVNRVGGIVGRCTEFALNTSSYTGTINGSGTSLGGIAGECNSGTPSTWGGFTNLTVNNCTINGNTEASDHVGGLLGHCNVGGYTIPSVINCTVNNFNFTGRDNIGGLVGYGFKFNLGSGTNIGGTRVISGRNSLGLYYGYMESSSSTQNITLNTGTISGTGQNIGGFAGKVWRDSTITNVIISGVTFNTANATRVGGLIGASDPGIQATNTVNNCTISTSITALDYVGGVAGWYDKIATGANITVTAQLTGRNYIGLVAGLSQNTTFNTPILFTGTINATGNHIGGMIGRGEHNAHVTNQTVGPNVTINASSTSNYVGGVYGSFNPGTSAGYTMTTCSVTVNITGMDRLGLVVGEAHKFGIDNTNTIKGNVTGRHYLGLITGQLHSTHGLTLNNNSGTVTGTGNYIGGLIGSWLYGGSCTGIILTQNVTVNASTTSDYVGGLVGQAASGTAPQSIFTDCKVINHTLQGRDWVGGLVGTGAKSRFLNCEFKGTINATGSHVGGIAGLTFDGGTGGQGINECLVRDSTITTTGSRVGGMFGSIEHIMAVANSMCMNVTVQGSTSSSDYVGGVIGSYSSGNQPIQSIQNVRTLGGSVTGRDYVGGIFGHVYRVPVSRCLNIATTSGRQYVGGVAGNLQLITGSQLASYTTVTGTGGTRVGGIAGRANETTTLSDCYAHSNVVGVSGTTHLGGLVGQNEGGNFTRCYSKGQVTGASSLGGLVGSKSASQTSVDCFWDTQTSGQSSSAMGTGRTTTEMKTQATYTNYDFNSVWTIHSTNNEGYPFLVQVSIEISTYSDSPVGVTIYYIGINNTTGTVCVNPIRTDTPGVVIVQPGEYATTPGVIAVPISYQQVQQTDTRGTITILTTTTTVSVPGLLLVGTNYNNTLKLRARIVYTPPDIPELPGTDQTKITITIGGLNV